MKKSLAIGLLSLFVLTACTLDGDTDQTTTPESNQTQNSGNITDTSMQDQGQTETTGTSDAVNISATNFAFSVEQLEAAPGETLVIRLAAEEGTHDFVIDELGVQSDLLSAGENQTIEIQIPAEAEVGTEYAFYCSVGSHRAMGMEGTLTVVGK